MTSYINDKRIESCIVPHLLVTMPALKGLIKMTKVGGHGRVPKKVTDKPYWVALASTRITSKPAILAEQR